MLIPRSRAERTRLIVASYAVSVESRIQLGAEPTSACRLRLIGMRRSMPAEIACGESEAEE